VTATCSAGKRVIGAGGMTSSGTRVVIQDAIPNAGLTSVQVNATKTSPGSSEGWRAEAVALCANAPAGLQRVAASTEADPEEIKTVTAACPAGKHLFGTGSRAPGRKRCDSMTSGPTRR
jgi:hypothetical protein